MTRGELLEAARYVDATLSEHNDLVRWYRDRGIAIEDVAYLASQRALRAGMVLEGQDPTLLSRSVPSPVTLRDETKLLVPTFAAVWIDGMAIGWQAQVIEEGYERRESAHEVECERREEVGRQAGSQASAERPDRSRAGRDHRDQERNHPPCSHQHGVQRAR